MNLGRVSRVADVGQEASTRSEEAAEHDLLAIGTDVALGERAVGIGEPGMVAVVDWGIRARIRRVRPHSGCFGDCATRRRYGRIPPGE